jgi:ribosomal protein S18 acetylase RimI-like enzyme
MGLFYKATLIGFGLVDGADRLAFLAVDAAYRGSGAGSQLLESVLATLDFCYLVPVNNLKVIDWYHRHGFLRMSAERNYAADEAHFIMTYVARPETVAQSRTINDRDLTIVI